MYQRTIDLVMPADMAQILIDEGLAELTFGRRSTALTILAEAASVTSVTISLLQGPSTAMQVAHAIKEWIYKRRDKPAGSNTVTIASSEREGTTVNADTEITIVIAVLQAAITASGDFGRVEDIDGMTILFS